MGVKCHLLHQLIRVLCPQRNLWAKWSPSLEKPGYPRQLLPLPLRWMIFLDSKRSDEREECPGM